MCACCAVRCGDYAHDCGAAMKLIQGTYMDCSVEEYRAWPAINYSSLADFNESQDHALMEKPAKSYFEEGTAFELQIEDMATGTEKFSERFFIADAPGAMPDDLAGWIERGEDLESKYVWNKPNKKTGEVRPSLTHEKKHLWLDECRKHPGKMPVGADRKKMLDKMVENFMNMQPFSDILVENTMFEILRHAKFQVPIIWYVGKVRKKALIDCLVETPDTIYVFDIKTAADMSRFEWMIKSKYFLQECHYSAGLGQIYPDKQIVWRFLVSSKAEPYIAQPFAVDPFSMSDNGMQAYYDLCTRYQAWVDEGRPPKGWLEFKSVKVYFD